MEATSFLYPPTFTCFPSLQLLLSFIHPSSFLYPPTFIFYPSQLPISAHLYIYPGFLTHPSLSFTPPSFLYPPIFIFYTSMLPLSTHLYHLSILVSFIHPNHLLSILASFIHPPSSLFILSFHLVSSRSVLPSFIDFFRTSHLLLFYSIHLSLLSLLFSFI